MKMNKPVYLITGILALSTLVGLANRPANGIEDGKTFPPTQTTLKVVNKAKTQKPATKTATISVEGEKSNITLRLYEQSSLQFSTYYPANYFVSETSSSGEGTGVRFIVNAGGIKNDKAYVHFAFMNGMKNIGQVKNFVNGKRGLIASNGWRVVSRTQKVPYRWSKEKISFQQRKGNEIIQGNVYLGEYKGKAFYVISHYPGEYGDGFGPREALILENLDFAR